MVTRKYYLYKTLVIYLFLALEWREMDICIFLLNEPYTFLKKIFHISIEKGKANELFR